MPHVSIYRGPSGLSSIEREAVLDAMRAGREVARVNTFTATVSPNKLHGDSWAEVVLTRRQIRLRARLKREPQIAVRVSKGVETTLNTSPPRQGRCSAQAHSLSSVGPSENLVSSY